MVAIIGSPNKQDMDLKLPILHNDTVPKKKAATPKVLAIKLPLDIDINIHREYHHGFVLPLILLVLLFVVPFLFMYSFHQQIQLYEYELAELRMKIAEVSFISSSITASSLEIENIISRVQSGVKRCDCNNAKADIARRRKRDTGRGEVVAVRAVNEQNDINQNKTSNDTKRGNFRIHRSLIKPERKRNGFGAVRAVHFKGLLPENLVEAGQIGPWYEDQQAVGDFGLQGCKLRDRGVKLIVNETGLYLIYAQVYYLTSKSLNSYSINVNPGNKATSIPVAFCSANASLNDQGASEVSCYTSVVRRLQAGDAISLQQQERQRRLLMRDGHSFVGLVRLS